MPMGGLEIKRNREITQNIMITNKDYYAVPSISLEELRKIASEGKHLKNREILYNLVRDIDRTFTNIGHKSKYTLELPNNEKHMKFVLDMATWCGDPDMLESVKNTRSGRDISVPDWLVLRYLARLFRHGAVHIQGETNALKRPFPEKRKRRIR